MAGGVEDRWGRDQSPNRPAPYRPQPSIEERLPPGQVTRVINDVRFINGLQATQYDSAVTQ